MHTDRIPKKVCNMLKYHENCAYQLYVSTVHTSLFSHGFGFKWIDQRAGDTFAFLCLYKKVATDIYHPS